MKKILYQTPNGTESIHQTVLDDRIELLKARLSACAELCASLPVMELLSEQMLPTVRQDWARTDGSIYFLEITPTHLSGLGFTVAYRELIDRETVLSPMEIWAFALTLAEALRSGLPHPEEAVVCPLFVENALNMVIENHRYTVALQRKTEP